VAAESHLERRKPVLISQLSQSQPITLPTAGIRRATAGTAPSMHEADMHTLTQIVNNITQVIAISYAINVRPPPDLLQGGTWVTPGKCREKDIIGRFLVCSECLCCAVGREGGRASSRALFSTVSWSCLGSRGRSPSSRNDGPSQPMPPQGVLMAN
jgi:hypothetical protein